MPRDTILIAPSILSADYAHLAKDIRQIEQGGADWIHIDVMDGNFVPNITFGPLMVGTINSLTGLVLDVHLMIVNPEKYLKEFSAAGADIITVHQETCPHLHRTIQQIHDLGARAGVSINPGTSISTIEEIICDADLILIMSVNPGFGGQRFIDSSLRKIEAMSALLKERDSKAYLEVDGGIDETNAAKVVQAGCRVLVSGTGVFKNADKSEGVRLLREAATIV